MAHVIVQLRLRDQGYYVAQSHRCTGLAIFVSRAMPFEQGVQVWEVGLQERKLRLTRTKPSSAITFQAKSEEG